MSIRGRLARTLLLAIVPLVLAAGVGLYLYVRTTLAHRLDEAILARAQILASRVGFEAGELEFDQSEERASSNSPAEIAEFFEIWTLRGGAPDRVLVRSASLGGADLRRRVPTDEQGHTAWNDDAEGGPRVRATALRLTMTPDEEDAEEAATAPGGARSVEPTPVMVVVARDRGELDRTLSAFAAALWAAGAGLIAATLVAVRFALARGLRPVDHLAARISAIQPNDLSQRLDLERAPRELAPIAAGTNQLLERLSAAFEREKRLAASAAHELRTPLAEIRAATELALSRERQSEEYRRTLGTVLAISARMSDATDAVLRLARVQSGREKPVLASVDVRDALAPAWARWIEPLRARGVDVAFDIPRGVRVYADRGMLGVIFENLCANAAEHTPNTGLVTASADRATSGRVTVRIRNSTNDRHHSAPDESERRARESQRGLSPASQAPLHASLGLSLCRAFAEVCGGSFHADERGRTFEVSVTLPDPGIERDSASTLP